jgi:hypothetical protein
MGCKKVGFVDLEEGKRLCQVFEEEDAVEAEPVVRKSHCCEVF